MSVELLSWLANNGRSRLCVVSPHFDDAVYSSYAALALADRVPCVVATMVTQAPAVATEWSTLMGFTDSRSEHLSRALEDSEVLADAGVRCVHLGGESGNPESCAAAMDLLATTFVGAGENWAFLLPAGAGVRLGRWGAYFRRKLGVRVNGAAHPEHVLARDLARSRLAAAGGTLYGYYAEHPYLQYDDIGSLHRSLERIDRRKLARLRCAPDASRKLRSAEGYVSQADVLLGRSPAERRAFASRDEIYFLGEAGD